MLSRRERKSSRRQAGVLKPDEQSTEAEAPTGSRREDSRGQADESLPAEQTNTRNAEAEHEVRDGRQVSLPGGRRGEQVGNRQSRHREIRQEMNAGKSRIMQKNNRATSESAGEAYMQG